MLRYLINQGRVIILNQPTAMRRKLLTIGLLTTLVGFLEVGVAGFVSILGVSLTAPQSALRLPPIRFFFSIFPTLEQPLQNHAILLSFILCCVVIAVFCKNILIGSITYIQSYYAQESSSFFGSCLFRSYIRKPYLWHLQQNAAELLLFFDYRTHVGLFLNNLLTIVTQSAIAASLLAGGLILAPVPTVIVIAFTGTAALLTFKFSRHRIRRHTQIIAEAGMEIYKQLMAGFHGIRDVQVYRQEHTIHTGLTQQLFKTVSHHASVFTLGLSPAWILECFGMLTLFATLGYMIQSGETIGTITGTLSLLSAMAWRMLPCANKCLSAFVTLQGNRTYLDHFFSGLDLDALHAPAPPTQLPPLSFKKSIMLEQASFCYPNAKKAALQDIALTIPKGKMTGIIGHSGAGKSTIIGILTGLLPLTSGTIRIDEQPLPQEEYPRIRSLVGFVPQAPYLMDASLAENIAFSRLDQPRDDAAVHRACTMAALDFWEQLPEGLDTCLGERGMRISGGQAQRVAIARALYANPELLIFDEATSALDGATEHLIQETILNLRGHTTVVIVAHRLSTVEKCDHIYWVDSGKIVASGTPEQILPRYREMHTSKKRN